MFLKIAFFKPYCCYATVLNAPPQIGHLFFVSLLRLWMRFCFSAVDTSTTCVHMSWWDADSFIDCSRHHITGTVQYYCSITTDTVLVLSDLLRRMFLTIQEPGTFAVSTIWWACVATSAMCRLRSLLQGLKSLKLPGGAQSGYEATALKLT
jgi:hypothetical protein